MREMILRMRRMIDVPFWTVVADAAGRFHQLFRIMRGLMCIRLFDPPLHEFLPTDRAGMLNLAEALDLPCPP